MPPDNTILMGAGVALLGIVGLWMIRSQMETRDEVRALRVAYSDPRTGLGVMLDRAMSLLTETQEYGRETRERVVRVEDRLDAHLGLDD